MLASLLVIVFIVPTRAAEVAGLLAPKLQDLLRQEMQAVLIATDEIVNASIEGDYAKLADSAQQIHDSFILEQAMTEEDRTSGRRRTSRTTAGHATARARPRDSNRGHLRPASEVQWEAT